ncbi:hypothetical protein IV203_000471 [Nitzschia inconspicua]|uniref:MULE transposase domain-containing protein n=1 Tax=Nitzschia inconspicua TaxID=303405 RepID=A0A9K3L6G1_9STRA|nr:hypothetical protein IV203_000471 [Nitzschia inconspicua]
MCPPPAQGSENDCHDDVFLRLLGDLPNNDNDIDAAPDDPDKALLLELDNVPPNPQLGADPQPERTIYRDNYFTTQFIEVPKEFEDKLEESVDHVIEVKDSTPVSKDVMKAAANVQGVRASYNQAYRAIGRAVANAPREKQQASFGLIMSYLNHFQLRNEDSTVTAESDADQRLRRLGIDPGIMKHSLEHVRPMLSLDGAHLMSKWKGTLYIALVQTACNNIYPVSFAIMQQVFPDNHHCFCSVHIARNVEREVGKQVAKHVYALSATFFKRESDELMAKINAVEEHRLSGRPNPSTQVRHCDNKHVRVCKLNGWRGKKRELARVYQ